MLKSLDPTAAAGDATVDLQKEFEASNIDDVFEKLDRDLVGLKPVKTRIREIAALLLVDRLRRKFGISSETPTLHMNFTGNPGTGKTTVALRMAEILHRLGYVREGHLVSVTRDDLVGQYVGHTAPKTREVIKRAMGGVLFIDEAYYLYKPENERDYGQESIEILLQCMENNRDDLVVILAGYKNKMDRFFDSNPGMRSRIAHHLDFPDYSPAELKSIAEIMLSGQNYRLSEGAAAALEEYIPLRMKLPHFSNARSIRNALDRARLRQASRLFAARSEKLTKLDLITIEEQDIRGSRVFVEGKLDGDRLKARLLKPPVDGRGQDKRRGQMTTQAIIAPSILSADFSKLGDEVEAVAAAGADWIHLDVMDGHFVPNITFGPPVVKAIRNRTDKVFDCHLMIAPADPYLAAFAEAGADIITVHAEAGPHLDRSLQTIKSLGKKAGLSLNPATPESAIEYVLDRLDLVLLMTVNPGFGGQAFIPAVLEKVRRVKAMIGQRPIDIEIDGGVTPETAPLLSAAGANVLVAGSAIFKGGSTAAYRANIAAIRGAADGAARKAA